MSKPDSKTAIFVLGMHRSGTSALAGALAASGARLGEDLLPPQAGVNDKGFWEHRTLVRLNEALLQFAGQRWYSPFAGEVMAKLDVNDTPATFREDAHRFVEEEAGDSPLFAIKDPRLCLTAHFWRPIFERAGYRVVAVHMLRPPAEVMGSLARRDGLSPSHCHALWLGHVAQAEHFCSAVTSTRTYYDRLLTHPQPLLQELAHSLDVPLTPDKTLLQQWLQPDMRHQRSSASAPGTTELERTAQATYERLLAGAHSMPAGLEELTPLTRELMSELAEIFLRFNGNIQALQSANKDRDRQGELYGHAITIIEQRDRQLAQSQDQLERIGKLHAQAMAVVQERDRQLAESQGHLERIGTLHAQAIAVVQQRDQQLADLQAELNRIGEMHSNALAIIAERDQHLDRLREQIQVLEKLLGPLGRIKWRRINNKKQDISST